MSKELTVANMPVEIKARLTDAVKKQLVPILNNAFRDKERQFDYEIKAQKKKILEDYKKKVGFESLAKKYRQHQAEMDNVTDKIRELGLDLDGDIDNNTRYKDRHASAIKLEKELENLADSINPIKEMRSKLETRLWMAQTIGEANVIMRQVLGNTEIPTLTMSELKEI